MVRGICIIFLLGTITYSLSAPDAIDTINVNLNFGEGINTASDYIRKWEDGNTNGNDNVGSDNDYGYHRYKKYKKVKVDPAKFAGRWVMEFTDGAKFEATVNRDGTILLNGRTSFLQQSDNQVDFPSSEGWMKATKSVRDEHWDYIRMVKDDKAEIHEFCSDICHKKYNNLQNYCCMEFAVRKESRDVSYGYGETG